MCRFNLERQFRIYTTYYSSTVTFNYLFRLFKHFQLPEGVLKIYHQLHLDTGIIIMLTYTLTVLHILWGTMYCDCVAQCIVYRRAMLWAAGAQFCVTTLSWIALFLFILNVVSTVRVLLWLFVLLCLLSVSILFNKMYYI